MKSIGSGEVKREVGSWGSITGAHVCNAKHTCVEYVVMLIDQRGNMGWRCSALRRASPHHHREAVPCRSRAGIEWLVGWQNGWTRTTGGFPRSDSNPLPLLTNWSTFLALHFSPLVSRSAPDQNCHQSQDACDSLAPSCPSFTVLTIQSDLVAPCRAIQTA